MTGRCDVKLTVETPGGRVGFTVTCNKTAGHDGQHIGGFPTKEWERLGLKDHLYILPVEKGGLLILWDQGVTYVADTR